MTPVAEARALRPNPIASVGFVILILYLFLLYGRVLDYAGQAFRIPAITFVVLAVLTVFSGALFRGLGTRIGVLFVALTILMSLTVPFSLWPRLSLELITQDWIRTWVLYFAIVGMALTTRHVVVVLWTVAVALAVHAVLAAVAGGEVDGRYYGVGRFADPNELGLACLIASCMILALATYSKHAAATLGYYAFIPVMFLVMAKTGSRGMFVTALAVGIYLFFRASLKGKVQIAFLAWIVVAIAGLLIPEEVYKRYSTFETSTPEEDTMSAAGSFRSRQYLFERSVEITFRNPLLGTGTGTFMIADNDAAIEEGRPRGSWHQTHNTFTQISSENGIPALILFIAICISFWRSAGRVKSSCESIDHPDAKRLQRMVHFYRAALLALLVGAQFLSIGYSDFFPVMGGIAVALERAVAMEIPQWQAVPAAPPPPPRMSRWQMAARQPVRTGR
ncbi:MAG: O-antigen ligase family protein [Bryobacterales bacterium]|nr:O-antigen ligase family protein [Bryobacterales bacterium]